MSGNNPKPTILTVEEIIPFAKKFDIGAIQQWEFLANGYGTSNHKVTTDRGTFVVKETYIQDQRDIPAMYNLLVDQGIPTTSCYSLRDDPSTYALTLPNGNSVFVQNYLAGDELQPEQLKVQPELWYKIGKMIGKVHSLGISNVFTKRKWKTDKFDISRVGHKLQTEFEVDHIQEFRKDELLSSLETLYEKTTQLDTSNFLKGLIHGDWYATCFILDEDQNITGLLDFNTAEMNFVVLDALRKNNYWEDTRIAELFLEGYFSTSPVFTEEEILALPLLNQAHSVELIDYFGWRAENNVTTGLPDGEEVMQGYWDFTNDFIAFDYEKIRPSLDRIVEYARDFDKIRNWE